MSLAYYLHMIIPIYIILMPFLPVKILKKIFYLPIILPLMWIIFGECPLNKLHKKQVENKDFIQSILSNLYPKISKRLSNNITTFILLLSVVLSALKIMIYYKIYKLS